ncbi:MAG: SusD/RagB family nutrient-binding outer rane lipoprotein [Pedobacter sp.]|jgi:hypothetical protein|nr:SusD/RagB family nutrient-binding outer rane lipoprotein [Pedobacter sp.]
MKTKYIDIAKKLLVLLAIGTIGLVGCKKFIDVNENPNNPVTATPNLLLPVVEAGISQLVGNNYQIYGNIWAEYWTQGTASSQYRSLEQYNVTNTAFDGPWNITYRNVLQNAQTIINSTAPNNELTRGIAYILKAYTVQLTTDAYGDIPLTEALNASQFASPHYDPQQLVYDSIFNYIDLGIASLNVPNATSPGEQDMLFGGDIAQWTAFANTLKLRAYLRLSQVDPAKAQAGIEALYTGAATFLTEDATMTFTTTGGNENPLYNEMLGLGRTQNLVASATAVTHLKANRDPRLNKYYDLIPGQDTIAYIPQGSYRSNSGKLVSPPSPLVGGNASAASSAQSAVAPVKLISAAESYFLQAEAAARGWGGTPAQAAALFNSGITTSFTGLGLSEAQATSYIATAADAKLPGNVNGNIRAIITQKYYAMDGFQGFEAWTEWRRTGYPDFLVPSVASIIGAGKVPLRFLYPNSELTTNLNYPGTQTIDTPVWWDK